MGRVHNGASGPKGGKPGRWAPMGDAAPSQEYTQSLKMPTPLRPQYQRFHTQTSTMQALLTPSFWVTAWAHLKTLLTAQQRHHHRIKIAPELSAVSTVASRPIMIKIVYQQQNIMKC
eukprot:scaffold521877_cov38-Prasinocladus_malaysianus.AAC.1